ncbi:hypothetical protein HF086_003992 [Spodoptera exigua]|uniref:Salivary secreted peptide n=1 Tax=Spodoptera exigua TaxID=7107 RepID=A0A922M5D1_SPOEX|nr:hypothetical protein HF086_003992 [Spodoptera exigua]
MKCVLALSVFVLIAISSCFANDLIIGTSYNARLSWQHKAEYMGIPFKKRVKEVFYSDPGQQIIKEAKSDRVINYFQGIIARDIDHTSGSATVTAGGVGFSFANIRLKSERGSGLNYQIEIYV